MAGSTLDVIVNEYLNLRTVTGCREEVNELRLAFEVIFILFFCSFDQFHIEVCIHLAVFLAKVVDLRLQPFLFVFLLFLAFNIRIHILIII